MPFSSHRYRSLSSSLPNGMFVNVWLFLLPRLLPRWNVSLYPATSVLILLSHVIIDLVVPFPEQCLLAAGTSLSISLLILDRLQSRIFLVIPLID